MNNHQILTYIFVTQSYFSNISPQIKGSDESLVSHYLNTDLSLYIDKDKVKGNYDLSKLDFNVPCTIINNKYIFIQILSVENIAEPRENPHAKDYDNLDEIEDDDNKYLQGVNDENTKKERFTYAFGFTTDGKDNFLGFEYKDFNVKLRNKIQQIQGQTPVKALIGPNVEVRRGIFLLTNENFNILLNV